MPKKRNKIKSLGLEKYISFLIVTDEFGGIEFRKPNTKAFVKMKENFSIRYDEMLYVGDNISKDPIAPLLLGANYIHLLNSKGLYYKEEVDFECINSLKDLVNIL